MSAYTLSDLSRDSSKDFRPAHLQSIPVTGHTYLWGRGDTMWVATRSTDKLYSFNVDPTLLSTDTSLSSLTVDGVAVPGLDDDRTEPYEFGVAPDVSQVTIAAVPGHSSSSVTFSVEDADDGTGGHQIDLSRGRNEVIGHRLRREPHL